MENVSKNASSHGRNSEENSDPARVKASSEESPKRKRRTAVEDLKKSLDEEKQRAQDNYEKFLRVYAELENYKKRAEKEKADRVKYANETLIRDLLPFVDNLQRAVEHASSEKDNDPKALIDGIELTLKDLTSALEKHGLRPIESAGRPFDPNLHEAIMQVESADNEPQTIVEEFQRGYLLNDRLLRPARVSVAMGPEESGEEEGEG